MQRGSTCWVLFSALVQALESAQTELQPQQQQQHYNNNNQKKKKKKKRKMKAQT